MNEEFFAKSYRTRSTQKNRQSKIITQRVPKFNWDKFIRLPNAADFVEKQYYEVITRMMREIDEQKNGNTVDHLSSMESIIARSIIFTATEIKDWCDQQDWEEAGITNEQTNNIKKFLSEFGMRKGGVNAECSLRAEVREKLAQRVAQIAKKDDSLAEWLFTRLTAQRSEDGLAGYI